MSKINWSTNKRLYGIWSDMKTRCYNPKAEKYKWYGAKEIIICDEWKNRYETFYNWALANGYKDDLTIDREDNKGNYEPSNCRFVTREKNSGRATEKLFTINGITKNIANWCKLLGCGGSTVTWRLKAGWNIEKALTTPPKKFKKK